MGSLVDKLTIIKLKMYHTEDKGKWGELCWQSLLLKDEIDEFIANPPKNLYFPSHKVCDIKYAVNGTMGVLISDLAHTNCAIWHLQEDIYNFHNVAPSEKDFVVDGIANLNIKRTNLIEEIDKEFSCITK